MRSQDNEKEVTRMGPDAMTVSKRKKPNRTSLAEMAGMFMLMVVVLNLFGSLLPAFAQGAAGAGAGAGSDAMSKIRNNYSPGNIRWANHLRNKAGKQYSDADTVSNQESQGPGTVSHGGEENNPIQMWPTVIMSAQSQVPTMRDTAITKNMFKTFGYPLSDTQYQIIERYNQNRFLEQLYDPEKAHWMANATSGLAANSAANSMAAFAINQALAAIDFCKQFLTNFTAEPDNVWQRIRDQLFVPMAVLLLLPGAVLAQVKAIVAQGSPVLVGDVHPFEGLLRSIVAIFLIPGTFLVINYGIDVANSLTYTIADEYHHIFGSDMYEDAKCAIIRAFPMNKAEWNRNAVTTKETPRFEGNGNWAPLEGYTLATARIDPCAGIEESRAPDEDSVHSKNINRLMMNGLNDTATMSWNLACAFQMAFLYYLWCMGPIAAALWVWPVQALRGALASWIDGVITICFWSLFWNTTILLMACFRGVGDSGTIIMTALIFLAVQSVKSAFDFSDLATRAVGEAASQAQKAANAAKGGGAGGGQGSGSGQSSGQGNKSGSSGGSPAGSAVGSSSGASVGGDQTPGGATVGNSQALASTNASGVDSGTIGGTGGTDGKPNAEGLQGALGTNAGNGSNLPKADAAVGADDADAGLPPTAKGGLPDTGDVGGGDLPPLGDAASAAMGGTLNTNGQLNVSVSGSGDGGGGGFTGGSGSDSTLGGSTSNSFMGPDGKGNDLLAGGTLAGLGGIGGNALNNFDINGAVPMAGNKFEDMFSPTAASITDQLNGPSNSLLNAGAGNDVFGQIPGSNSFGGDSTGNNAFLRTGADGQPVVGADGKPMLDTARVGDIPTLPDNIANDPGALSAQKTAVDTMAMSGVTTENLARAMADPAGAEYKSIMDTVGVAPPVLDAALHGNASAGAITAVGFGGTETANTFASPGYSNDTATMATGAYQQAQAVAGADTGMIDRATRGMDTTAASSLLASPASDASFSSSMAGYQRAYDSTGSYTQTDSSYSSIGSYGSYSSGVSSSMIGGELSPSGTVAAASGFSAPYSVASNDAGAISAHAVASDVMALTHTQPAELARALADPNGAEYRALSERMGSSPALVDAALHGSAGAAAIVETGFGGTAAAQANAATSFTAQQSVSMYQAASATYGADMVHQAAVNMDAGAGTRMLQSDSLDRSYTAAVSSYGDSYQSVGNYSQVDSSYLSAAGPQPAVTSSAITGDASPAGAIAASMGYSSSAYSVPSDAGAVSANRAATDIMAMTGTQPEVLARALANPGGQEYQDLSARFGASPVLVDAALHGSASAAAIVETGFGQTQTAHAYADNSFVAQQSVSMYQSASTAYGADTVQQAAQGLSVAAGETLLRSPQMDQQYAATVGSYQQAYQSTGNFTNVDSSYVSASGATPVVTSSMVANGVDAPGALAAASGYSAPYAVPSNDVGAVGAQRAASDIMAMTHTTPAELQSALANPQGPQYQQLAERMGASPALIDSALHGNVSAGVVASAGFGGTETAHRFESQSATAAQALQYNASAQAAAVSSGATNGAEYVHQAAVNLNEKAGAAILSGTGLDNQYTATVNAYRAEAEHGRGFVEAPVVPNYISSSGGSAPMSQDMVGGTNLAQYSGGTPAAGTGAYDYYTAGNSGQAHRVDWASGSDQPVPVHRADYSGTPATAHETTHGSATGWATPEVHPDTTLASSHHDAASVYQEQHHVDTGSGYRGADGSTYIADSGKKAPSTTFRDVLGAGGAGIANAAMKQNRAGGTGATPVTPVDKGKEAAPPVSGQVVKRDATPNAGKGRGKTQKEIDEENARMLAEMRANMPGNNDNA